MPQRTMNHLRALIVVSFALFIAAFSRPALAQAPITSTSQLKQACETSPGNRVIFNSSTEINQGVAIGVTLPNYEQVRTGCTLVLGPSSSLEFDSVAINFAGPLRIESAAPNTFAIEKANLYATTVSVALPANGSAVMIKEGNLYATGGDLSVALGNEAKLELSGNGTQRMLEASGVVRLTGGEKLSATLVNGGFYGVGGIAINLPGNETTFKADEWALWSQTGRTDLRTGGAKTLVELGRGNYYGYSGASIVMTGAESTLIAKNRNFNTYEGPGVSIDVGGSAPMGQIKFDEARFGGAGAVTIRASAAGTGGMIEITKGSVGVLPNFTQVVIETGAGGSTVVKETAVRSAGLARIASGSGGLCLSEVNTIVAATRQLCP